MIHRMQSIHMLWIGMILHSISQILCIDPKFDPSTRMRVVLVPADAAVGSVIYRLRATDEEFDYPLQFELVGKIRVFFAGTDRSANKFEFIF